MRRDIYQEYPPWTPASSADLDFLFRPVPDDMILQINYITLYNPTASATAYYQIGIDNHGQFIPLGSYYITAYSKSGYTNAVPLPIFLYEHQRLQLILSAVEVAEIYHMAIRGILYDADEWRKGLD